MEIETKENKGFPEFPEFYKNSPYRDFQGRLLSSKLFYERTTPDKRDKVLYTLKDQDHEGYKSLYLLYMESNDLTEYTFANDYFESYEHWLAITKQDWFKPFLERFRRDLETKVRSTALRAIIRESQSGSKNAFTANKFLIERGWVDKEKNTKGRPTKEDIKQAAMEQADSTKRLEEDFLRIVEK
jgi:hypothetical protein